MFDFDCCFFTVSCRVEAIVAGMYVNVRAYFGAISNFNYLLTLFHNDFVLGKQLLILGIGYKLVIQ